MYFCDKILEIPSEYGLENGTKTKPKPRIDINTTDIDKLIEYSTKFHF